MNNAVDTEYVNSKTAGKALGVSTKTLRVYDKENRIRTIRLPSGARRYNIEDIKNIIGRDTPSQQKKKMCYCRVSSPKQADDLVRQTDYFKSKYPNHTVVTDIGSGINWKRKGLQTILDSAIKGDIDEVVVAHRDRLCRFAFDILEWILNRCGVQLLVLDQNQDESGDSELTDDILSIIHVYSCRKMGRRRYNKNKKDTVLPDNEKHTDAQEEV